MQNQLFTALFILFTLVSFAQEKSEVMELPKGELFTSTQSVTVNDKTITLHTETGTVILRDENDKPIALFGFTHYKKSNSNEKQTHCFCF